MLPQLATQERHTPLQLSVDIKPDGWLVSWNPRATAIRAARGARLFMTSAVSHKQIDLGPTDLSTGTYRYPLTPGDATFRLEVDERSGYIAAESFRLVRRLP